MASSIVVVIINNCLWQLHFTQPQQQIEFNNWLFIAHYIKQIDTLQRWQSSLFNLSVCSILNVLLLLVLLGCGSDWKLTRMTQRIILRIRSDMHATQLQLLLLWLLLLLLLLLLMSGPVNETTAFNVLENCKKKFVIHKNKHIKATLCSRLLLTPSHQSPDSRRQLACRLILLLPLLLFAPEGDKIILQCWHILCLLNQPTERTESNRTELNWTRLSSTGPGLNRTLSGPPHSSLPRVPSKSEPQFVHASFD